MQIVLLGAGHAHVEVLRRLARRPIAGAQVTLVTREPLTPYSGMLPGVVRGDYRAEQAQVDCPSLARSAGVRSIIAAVQGIDLAEGRVALAGNRSLRFDLLSLNLGGEPIIPDGSTSSAGGVVPVKPLSRFLNRLEEVERRLHQDATLAVVGNGPAGVELALALARRVAKGTQQPRATVVLVGQDREPLIAAPRRVRRAAVAALERAHVKILSGAPATGYSDSAITLADGRRVPATASFWATGVIAPSVVSKSGIAVDPAGCVLVNAALRSTSDKRVFAVGDCAAFDPPLPKAGVWAVRAGPILECNLRRAAAGQSLLPWRPQRHALVILGLGRGHALAWRGRWVLGGLHLDGRLAWWWKDWLDRRWVRRYRVR